VIAHDTHWIGGWVGPRAGLDEVANYYYYYLRVLENRLLRRIFGPKREEMAGGWRRLHNKELHNVYASPNIVRVIKSRRMRWVRDAARMG
jgi:hypothetical protein